MPRAREEQKSQESRVRARVATFRLPGAGLSAGLPKVVWITTRARRTGGIVEELLRARERAGRAQAARRAQEQELVTGVVARRAVSRWS